MLSVLITFLIFNMNIIKIIHIWLATFVFLLLLTFILFHSTLSNLFYSIRTKYGELVTSIYKLDKKFKTCGGIIGYENVKEKHVAIIFPSDSSKNYKSTEDNDIVELKNYYLDKNENYKVYFCYLVEDFINIVKSQYVYGIHIFGHGRIDRLTFEDGAVLYREFKGIEPKEFVAQWHCNHRSFYKNSLGRIIGKKYYVKYGMRNYYSNKKDIKKLVIDELDWTYNDNVSD